jgi:hypothetical protein
MNPRLTFIKQLPVTEPPRDRRSFEDTFPRGAHFDRQYLDVASPRRYTIED